MRFGIHQYLIPTYNIYKKKRNRDKMNKSFFLTGNIAIGPVGKNLCHAVLFSTVESTCKVATTACEL